jgi:hypothetical protein
MKNPQITQKLIDLMNRERAAKLEVIACILDNYTLNSPQIDLNQAFNDLYDMEMHELNDILSDLISETFAQIQLQLERIEKRK